MGCRSSRLQSRLVHGINLPGVPEDDDAFAAAFEGDIEKLEQLLKRRDTIVIDTGKRNLLHWAVLSPYIHDDIVEYLLKKGVNIDHKDENGWTPLFVAACNHEFYVSKLLDHDPDGKLGMVQAPNNSVAVHWAATNKRAAPLLALKARGYRLDVVDNEGNTPLHYAGVF